MKEELAIHLTEDLNALNKFLYSTEPLHPSHVRITASAILRKWFIESWIDKLAKEASVEYTFASLDTTNIVSAIDEDKDIQFFMTGGVNMDGLPIQGYYVSDGPPNSDGTSVIPIDKMEYKLFKPSRLLNSKRVYHNGTWFNFSEIIKFCANKYGGVHLDKRYTKEWQAKLEVASNYFIAGNPNHENERKIVEPYSDKHRILLVLPKEKGKRLELLRYRAISYCASIFEYTRQRGNDRRTRSRP